VDEGQEDGRFLRFYALIPENLARILDLPWLPAKVIRTLCRTAQGLGRRCGNAWSDAHSWRRATKEAIR